MISRLTYCVGCGVGFGAVSLGAGMIHTGLQVMIIGAGLYYLCHISLRNSVTIFLTRKEAEEIIKKNKEDGK